MAGTFDFDGNTNTSWNNNTNKYSRNLMPLSYSSSTTNPLFFIQGDYDNNILKVIYIFSKTGSYYLYLRKPPNKIIIDKLNKNLFNCFHDFRQFTKKNP